MDFGFKPYTEAKKRVKSTSAFPHCAPPQGFFSAVTSESARCRQTLKRGKSCAVILLERIRDPIRVASETEGSLFVSRHKRRFALASTQLHIPRHSRLVTRHWVLRFAF